MDKVILFDFFVVISSEVSPIFFKRYFNEEDAKIIKEEIMSKGDKGELSEEEISYFNNILIYGPREVERRTITTKIRLTKNGIRRFKTFYLNRPIPTEINDNIYVFNASHENLFVYFSRFGSDAEIIEPLNFRNQMINFHKKAYNKYLNE